MKHALVIGGTGMLKDVTLWLSEQGYHTSVIARSSEKLDQLKKQNPNMIFCIAVDYHHTEALFKQVKRAIEAFGPITLVVSWIHSTAKDALPTISNLIDQTTNEPWQLYHILGSRSFHSRPNFTPPKTCLYHSIFLGFQIENETSRWLTHEEISHGVKKAIQEKKKEAIVGTLTPWEMRPS